MKPSSFLLEKGYVAGDYKRKPLLARQGTEKHGYDTK